MVRGPEIREIEIVALDPRAQPPTMRVRVAVRGRRYLEDRDTTAVVSGSQSRPTTFQEHWTLALSGPDAHPWQIVDARAPAARR